MLKAVRSRSPHGYGAHTERVSHSPRRSHGLLWDAGIKGEHMVSHRLRDMFAVDLLEKGVPLEDVSKLLGHESIKTMEKHTLSGSRAGRTDWTTL